MFREMRRKGQEMPKEAVEAILRESTAGVLAVLGDEGYPYAVPVSHVFEGTTIYFHCAQQGHKLDAIRREARVSFCIIARDDVVAEEFTTLYQSVIAFGTARIVEEEEERKRACSLLFEKYAPTVAERLKDEEMAQNFHRVCIVAIDVAHITGKENRTLMQERKSEA